MGRRDRKRKPARRKPFRKPKPIILIVCEGKNTEPEYFEGLKKLFKNSRVYIKTEGGKGTPKTVVSEAKKLRNQARKLAKKQDDENLAYDAVWCAFDRDDHPDVPEAFEMAQVNGIEVAFSNPCFELWLLLHFRDQPGQQHRDKIISMVNELMPAYYRDSKHIDMDQLFPGYSKAVDRAKRLCESFDDRHKWDRNPYTNVHDLTKLITETPADAPTETEESE